MLWTGCKKVIALSPTLTYMYMYILGLDTVELPQRPPLHNSHLSTMATFFSGQSIHSILF